MLLKPLYYKCLTGVCVGCCIELYGFALACCYGSESWDTLGGGREKAVIPTVMAPSLTLLNK